MMKTLGVFTGAILALALLVSVLGAPRLGPQPNDDTPIPAPQARADHADDSSDDPVTTQAETPPPKPEPEPEAAVASETLILPTQEAAAQPLPLTDEQLVDAIFEPQPLPAPAAEAATVSDEASSVDTVEKGVDEAWHVFWSPFRSQLAADGFVAELQRNTGLDYRVFKRKPGVYEVAFAYFDDAELGQHLQTIELATGLEMPDG